MDVHREPSVGTGTCSECFVHLDLSEGKRTSLTQKNEKPSFGSRLCLSELPPLLRTVQQSMVGGCLEQALKFLFIEIACRKLAGGRGELSHKIDYYYCN